MCRFLSHMTILLLVPFVTGCVTCDSPFDQHYTASGGSVERVDSIHGRVNSAFVPVNPAPQPPAAPENAHPELHDGPLYPEHEATFDMLPWVE